MDKSQAMNNKINLELLQEKINDLDGICILRNHCTPPQEMRELLIDGKDHYNKRIPFPSAIIKSNKFPDGFCIYEIGQKEKGGTAWKKADYFFNLTRDAKPPLPIVLVYNGKLQEPNNELYSVYKTQKEINEKHPYKFPYLIDVVREDDLYDWLESNL